MHTPEATLGGSQKLSSHIPPSAPQNQWQTDLRTAVRSITRLHELGYLSKTEFEQAKASETQFQLSVPEYYLGLINKKDPNDPIKKMAIPSFAEQIHNNTALADPIGDLQHLAAPRLTHRYPDRALLHTNNLCPMYCRYCFRKNLMTEKNSDMYIGEFQKAFHYIRAHKQIEELILTGGDPWMLSDSKLESLKQKVILELPQIKRLRFHTRMPATLPSRITARLLEVLKPTDNLQIIVVSHFNHPTELSATAIAGLVALKSTGCLLLNQAVLLKDINDNEASLIKLFKSLGELSVLPYYLHHCDPAKGVEHFQTTTEEGLELMRKIRGQIPGYFIPEYVVEQANGAGKIPVQDLYPKIN